MNLTVYQFPHSPYCLPITRALAALGVDFDIHNVSNADRREILELTDGAHYQVPVLVHDGRKIHESSPSSLDVARYVDKTFAGGRLFPIEHEGIQRIVIGHLENDVEGITFRLVDPAYLRDIKDPVERGMIIRHKERKFGAGCVLAWERQKDVLTAQTRDLLEPYEQALRQRSFLFGDSPVYADFALYGIAGNLTYRDYNPLPEGFHALSDWYARISEYRFAVAESS